MAEASVTEQAQALTLQGSCSTENGEHMNGLNTAENNMADREIVQGLSKETRNGDLYKYSEDGEDFDPTYNNQSETLISPSTDQKVPTAFSDEDASHFHGDASQQFFESPQSAPDQEIPFGSDAAGFPPQHSEEALGSHIEDSFSPFTSEMSSYSHAGSQDSFTPFGGEKDTMDQEQELIQPSGLISPQPISQENVLIDFGKESEESESTEDSPAGDRHNPFPDDQNSNFASENMFSQPIVESKSGNDIPDPNGNAAEGVGDFTNVGQDMPDVSSNPVSDKSVLQPDLINMGESGLSSDSFVNKQEAHHVIDDFAQSNDNVPVMQSGVMGQVAPPPPQSFGGATEEASQEQYSDGDEDYSESESNSQLENDEIIEDDYTESDDNLDEMEDSEAVSAAVEQNSVKPDTICDNTSAAPAAVEHMEVEDSLKREDENVNNGQLPVDQMDHGASEQIPKDQLMGGVESDSDLEEGSISPDEAQYDNLDKQQLSPPGFSEASAFDNDKTDMVDQFETQKQNIADKYELEDHGFQEKESLSDSEVMEPEKLPTLQQTFSEKLPQPENTSDECKQTQEQLDRGSSFKREEETQSVQPDIVAEYEENDQKTPTEDEPDMSQEPAVVTEAKKEIPQQELSQWDEQKAEERYRGRSQSPDDEEFAERQFQQQSFATESPKQQETEFQQKSIEPDSPKQQETEFHQQSFEPESPKQQDSGFQLQSFEPESPKQQDSEFQQQSFEPESPKQRESEFQQQSFEPESPRQQESEFQQQSFEPESPKQQQSGFVEQQEQEFQRQEYELPSQKEQEPESPRQQEQEVAQDQEMERKPAMFNEQEPISSQQGQHFFDTRQEEEEYESDDNNEDIGDDEDFPPENVHEAPPVCEKPQEVPEDTNQGLVSNICKEADDPNFQSEQGQLSEQTQVMSGFEAEFNDQVLPDGKDEMMMQSDSHEASPTFEEEAMDEEDVMVESNIQEEDQFGEQESLQTQGMPNAAMMGSFVGTEEELGLQNEEFEDKQYTQEAPEESQHMEDQSFGKLENEGMPDSSENQVQDLSTKFRADDESCDEMVSQDDNRLQAYEDGQAEMISEGIEDRGGFEEGFASQSEEREFAVDEQKQIDAEGDSGPCEHALEEYSKDRMEEEDELPSHEDKEEVAFNEELRESPQEQFVIDTAPSVQKVENASKLEGDDQIPPHEEKEEEAMFSEEVALPPQQAVIDNLQDSSKEATGFEDQIGEKEFIPHEEKEEVAIFNEEVEQPQQQHVIETPPVELKEEIQGELISEVSKDISKVVDNKQEVVSSVSTCEQSGETSKSEEVPTAVTSSGQSGVTSTAKQETTAVYKDKSKEKTTGKVTKKEVKAKQEKPKPKTQQKQQKKTKEGTPPKETSRIPSPTKSGGKLPGQKASRAVKASTPPQWDSTTVTPPLPRVMSATRMPRNVARKQEEAAQRPTSIQQNSTEKIQTPPRPRPDRSPAKKESTSAFLARMSRPVQRGSTPKKDGSSDSGVEEDKSARQKSATRKKFGIDSHNTNYKPGGGNIKILNQKVTPKNVTSRIDARSATPTRSPTKPKPASTPSPKLPDTKHVQSKIGSLDNAKHTPGGGRVKIQSQKVDYSNVQSKTGSKDNIKHKAGGGTNKIESHKVEVKAESKIGSKDNIDHKAGGGDKKIQTQKLDFKEKASSKVGSKDLIDHKPGGGDKKIESQKLNFRETAKSRTNTGGATPSRPDSGISQDMAKPE